MMRFWGRCIAAGLIAGCDGSGSDSLRTPDNSPDTECLAYATTDDTALHLAAASAFLPAALEAVQERLPDGILAAPVMDSYHQSHGGDEHVEFAFTAQGVPICRHSVRAHRLASRQDPLFIGRFPPAVAGDELPAWGEDPNSAIDLIREELGLEGEITSPLATRCIAIKDDEVHGAWRLDFEHDGLPYYAEASEDVTFVAFGKFFHVDGSAKVYRKTPLNSSTVVLETFTLKGMTKGGTLCNARLVTQTPEGVEAAHNAAHVFNYAPSDVRFREVSLFAHGNEHADWLETLTVVSAWPGPQIRIEMDGRNDGLNNTAIYRPASSSKPPRIQLGNGDGKELKNLHLDGDVISHEMSHHLVYRTMKTISGESLVLHEGLADYFVFARTGNTCLGELICPSGTGTCIDTVCLRSADNTLKFTDSDLPTQGHKRSQFISAMLWDLGEGLTHTKMAELLYTAIDFLANDAGYVNFVIALMLADQKLNAGKNACVIRLGADNRGLKAVLDAANVDCSAYQ